MGLGKGDPRYMHRHVWLPNYLKDLEYGSVEGKVVVITGTSSRLLIYCFFSHSSSCCEYKKTTILGYYRK